MKDILHMDGSGKCFHQKAPSTGFERSRWDYLGLLSGFSGFPSVRAQDMARQALRKLEMN